MALTVDFVEYVCDQINGVGNITYKKKLKYIQRIK
jgi:hypothetical protein